MTTTNRPNDRRSGGASSPTQTHDLQATLARPLEHGERLTRAEFERRYRPRPDIKKVELLEGVVHLKPATATQQYANHHAILKSWLEMYLVSTPGVRAAHNYRLRLDEQSEPQPDFCVWIEDICGGQTEILPDGFLQGVPELIIEVAPDSTSYELREKYHTYRRAGVQEYLVLQVQGQKSGWFAWSQGEYFPLFPNNKGVLQSQAFAGLWFAAAAFWQGEGTDLKAALRQGLITTQHADFVEQLAAKKP